MIYIDKIQNPSGAYPNPKNQPFPGCIELNDEQANVFFEYNGFVIVSKENGKAVSVEPNVEAWEAWKASLPDPVPEPEEPASVWDELDAAYTAGYNEGYQEGVNTAYDNQ